MTPGELYWAEFPPANGHEQSKRRPAIVLQDDVYAGGLSVVLVVPVTGTLRNLRYPATVRVSPSEANGLLVDSVVLVFQARALDRKRFQNRIGVIEPAILARIHEALDRLMGRVLKPGTP